MSILSDLVYEDIERLEKELKQQKQEIINKVTKIVKKYHSEKVNPKMYEEIKALGGE